MHTPFRPPTHAAPFSFAPRPTLAVVAVALSPVFLSAVAADPPADGPGDAAAAARATAELDAFWAEASRTVRDGDYAGYAAPVPPGRGVRQRREGGPRSPIADQLAKSGSPGSRRRRPGRRSRRWSSGSRPAARPGTDPDDRPRDGAVPVRLARPAGRWETVKEPAVVRFEALLVRGPDGLAVGDGAATGPRPRKRDLGGAGPAEPAKVDAGGGAGRRDGDGARSFRGMRQIDADPSRLQGACTGPRTVPPLRRQIPGPGA